MHDEAWALNCHSKFVFAMPSCQGIEEMRSNCEFVAGLTERPRGLCESLYFSHMREKPDPEDHVAYLGHSLVSKCKIDERMVPWIGESDRMESRTFFSMNPDPI